MELQFDVFEVIERRLLQGDEVNIVIAGVSCSGKSTLAANIYNQFSDKYSVCVLHQDDYFKNLVDIPRGANGYLTDSIKAFHVEEFKSDVYKLFTNGVVTVPTYDMNTNSRICKKQVVRKGKINIFEGLHTISLLSRELDAICIYMDTEASVCLKRRIKRDTSAYGVEASKVIWRWKMCIAPMNQEYIVPQIKFADIILKFKE